MSYYRLYFMDNYTGHIERFEELDAADDRGAVALAETKLGPQALELWCSHRKVARFDALDLASQILRNRRTLKLVKSRTEPAPGSDDQAENRSA